MELPCPHRDACGGCALMPRPAAAQAAEKAERVERALGRGLDSYVPSPRPLGYRARIKLAVDAAGRLAYTRPRSRETFAIPACAIARPELNSALAAFGAAIPDARGLASVELRSDGRRVVFAARRDPARGRPPAGLPALGDVALDGRRLAGDPTVSITAGGITHRLGPTTFYQVNLEANALLVEAAGRAIRALAPAALLDAFSGAGNLSLPLAAEGLPVTLLEREGAALADARATAKRHSIRAADFRPGDANALAPGAIFFDAALLDPPRAGAKRLMKALLVTRPRAIVYVSCNPRTLGRDARLALAAGYRIERLVAFDFFPQTPHVETLCVLRRD